MAGLVTLMASYDSETDTIRLELPGVKTLAAMGKRSSTEKASPMLGYGQTVVSVPGIGEVTLRLNNTVKPIPGCAYWPTGAAPAAEAPAAPAARAAASGRRS